MRPATAVAARRPCGPAMPMPERLQQQSSRHVDPVEASKPPCPVSEVRIQTREGTPVNVEQHKTGRIPLPYMHSWAFFAPSTPCDRICLELIRRETTMRCLIQYGASARPICATLRLLSVASALVACVTTEPPSPTAWSCRHVRAAAERPYQHASRPGRRGRHSLGRQIHSG